MLLGLAAVLVVYSAIAALSVRLSTVLVGSLMIAVLGLLVMMVRFENTVL